MWVANLNVRLRVGEDLQNIDPVEQVARRNHFLDHMETDRRIGVLIKT